MANPTTNYGFVLPTATDLVTDLPADFDVALQGVDTRLKALQPGTTLGDIAYSSATANTNTRLAVGSNGQYLTVSGGVPAWAGISAGGMTLLSTTTLSGASTTISSIDQTYVNLVVFVFGVTNATADGRFQCLPNNVSNITTSGVLDFGGVVQTQTNEFIWLTATSYNQGRTNANNSRTITINNYASTTSRKAFSVNGGYVNDSGANIPVMSSGIIQTASAITSLVFSVTNTGGNFSTGTVLVYGVK
jgi:hypothetical protein